MSHHIGRSAGPSRYLEEMCPCPKAPCGLVDRDMVSTDCEEHPLHRMKTIRQSHTEENCPGPNVHYWSGDAYTPDKEVSIVIPSEDPRGTGVQVLRKDIPDLIERLSCFLPEGGVGA